MTRTIAKQLAEFIYHLDFRMLPGEVIDKARLCVLDQLGCQLVGSTLDWNKIVYDYVVGQRGQEESTIVKFGTKASALDAAFANGTFGQGAELDDCLEGGGSHPGSASIPVALALGEKLHLDGREFMTAVIAGYDIAYHLTRAMVPFIEHRGFHGQSVIGVFNATAVAARLLGLNVGQTVNALAIAGSHASGTMEYDQSGGEVKRMHTGLAVRGGMQSAILARMGLTGPPTIFEGKRGILAVFAGHSNASAITEGLGSDFCMAHVDFKMYPTNRGLQCPIEVLSGMMDKHGFAAQDVERIDVGVNERVMVHGASINEPRDTVGAQFSLAFSLAIRLLKGSNDLHLYTNPALWHDPQVLALARKVHPYIDHEAKGDTRFAARIRVGLAGGGVVEGHQLYPKGLPRNPLTQDELEQKFKRLAGNVIPSKQADDIIRMVGDIEELKDVSDLAAKLVAPGP
ncbi:MAG: MmgE/PrpD family protein [Chloroflexi bacterium]|nr:MmgE/PrpD family protein [Chloroflexota bacterium]